ncbi:hypothetical protein C8R44DRAFT_725401 [Mycena epipterygia]|nr:hypothetical protein C8R44DRAFT_725401 [Mycena epipterygia]
MSFTDNEANQAGRQRSSFGPAYPLDPASPHDESWESFLPHYFTNSYDSHALNWHFDSAASISSPVASSSDAGQHSLSGSHSRRSSWAEPRTGFGVTPGAMTVNYDYPRGAASTRCISALSPETASFVPPIPRTAHNIWSHSRHSSDVSLTDSSPGTSGSGSFPINHAPFHRSGFYDGDSSASSSRDAFLALPATPEEHPHFSVTARRKRTVSSNPSYASSFVADPAPGCMSSAYDAFPALPVTPGERTHFSATTRRAQKSSISSSTSSLVADPPVRSQFRVGQVVSTTSSPFVALFLACFDAAPLHVSAEDLLVCQQFINDRIGLQPSRPCIIAELPESPNLQPTVYLMTTLKGKELTDVQDAMASWVVKINTDTAHSSDAIQISPLGWRGSSTGGQWVIPFAFRPTDIAPRGDDAYVNSVNMAKLKSRGEECTRNWRRARSATAVGTSWRLVRSVPTVTSSAPAVQSPVNLIGKFGPPQRNATVTPATTMESRVNVAAHRGSRQLDDYTVKEYFARATSTVFHRGELAQIKEQLDYHNKSLLALRLDSAKTLLQHNNQFINYHTKRIQYLQAREAQAKHNMDGHTERERALWPLFGVPLDLWGSLRLGQPQDVPNGDRTESNSPRQQPAEASSPTRSALSLRGILTLGGFGTKPLTKSNSLPGVLSSYDPRLYVGWPTLRPKI